MKIEKIERSKHKQGYVLVFLEGEDLLRVTEDELLRFGLRVGLDISPETVVELRECAVRNGTRVRAVNLLSARPLSRRELQKRLCDRGASAQDAADTADWLEKIGALDDASYAKAIVHHYSANGYGAAKLRNELYRRGVPRDLWDAALAEAPDVRETTMRLIAARTKGRVIDERERKKLFDLLLRRGFSRSEAHEALNVWDVELD